MTFREFWQPLTSIYPVEEARWIGRFVFEMRYGLSQADLLMGREEHIDGEELRLLQQRLLTGAPVQYVIGETMFYGSPFYVEPCVLIPRPETEELCRHILARTPYTWHGDILDIGTGSGCIAVTLAVQLQFASVTAWDISPEALVIAARNARRNGVLTGRRIQVRNDVVFQLRDALNPPGALACWDIIVSNPPYVCEAEKATMQPNVLEHEPHLALFVPDDDPLRFYRAIGQYAVKALRPGGQLFFELNEHLANETKELLQAIGFSDIIIYKDQNQKDRFIRACR